MTIARIPFAFARSALFSVSPVLRQHSGPVMAAQDYRLSVEYTGPTLEQHHATAWQAATALAYKANGGQACDLRLVDMLRAMGAQSVQTHAKRRLLRVLAELTAGHLTIKTPRHDYGGPLLALRDIGGGRIAFHWPRGLLELLEDETVHLPLNGRATLRRYPLASWLHDYAATHRKVYEIELDTLRGLCGSTLARPQFKARLVPALEKVAKASSFLTGHPLAGDTLTLHKQATRVVLLDRAARASKSAQSRHLDAAQRAASARARVAL
ncbi:hypothetical protein [Stenotrophomonas maltophilia]|uniref:hypothetical protein n=1 Tax=Stenotrophomonas maltophilia TaxID=40324 RepID=UPI00066D1A3D|nr:hypothetical protein [Stenotrophomonas maltophilia]ELK2668561.1 hypothetical protein [Stenotrophomonas maltophilia]KUJ01539.1 hypothetical protein AR275_13820 [Stenotrophomonas maltophilia]MBH1376292.1 hypothetical protein [Stenotrophomonas maltophilia]MBH1439605.1 hypothetical protein [Stenotrophomonas maltophilia]MBH1558586.1 hypothetical protein [Stenotrophomonas maltophilia]